MTRYQLSLESAQDLSQETFIKIYTNLKKYNENFPFKVWLLTICKNVAIDYLRSKKDTSLINFAMKKPVQQSIDMTVCKKVTIEKAMSLLQPELAEIIQMRYYWR